MSESLPERTIDHHSLTGSLLACRKPGCGHQFCWICFVEWSAHQNQQCNVYVAEHGEQAQKSAREILARYMHYFTRYRTHDQSLELESRLVEQVEKRRQEMIAMSFTEQQAIPKAFEVLQRCRRTLKFTYPFAYYLQRDNQAAVFEANQADLERATEILSGFLEGEFDVQNKSVRELMDTTQYCDKRREILLAHCREGYRDRYWIFLD
jgi:ariadne-1